ncbi:hypothetical protein BH24ACT2_BH24ACT2_09450 [soil metagenome]
MAVLVFTVLCLGVGLPFAVLFSGDEEPRWASLAVEGVLLGLGWYLALGMVVARLGLLGRAEILVPSVVLAAAAWSGAVPIIRRWPRPRPTWFGGAVAGLFVIGAFLRRDAFYFLFQTADFGEYVNRANILAAGGPFHDWFLHLFSVTLGLSNVAFGPAGTVAIVPFLGLLVVAGVAATGQRLGFGRVVLAATVVVVALEPIAVWFSRFPASETLYAVLLVAFVHFSVLAVQRGRPGEVAVAAAFAGLMMITRANAVLLGPVLLVVLGVCAVLLRRPALRVLTAVVGASALTLYAGFVYNSRNSAAYFVDAQLEAFVPGRLFALVDSLYRPGEALVGLVVIGLGMVAAVGGAFVVNRFFGPSAEGRLAGATRLAVLPALALGLVAALFVAFLPVGLADAMPRYGWPFLGLVAVGALAVVIGVSRRPDDAGRVVGVLAVVIGGSFALLFAHRLPEAHAAPYHLYWDRYLFSEVFPAMALMGLWGVAAVAGAYHRFVHGRVPTPLVAAVLAVVLVGTGAQAQQRLGLQREQVLFDRAYAQFEELDELAAPAALPVIYSGVAGEDLPDGWLHTNTYRVFALPLQQSFGRYVLNIAGVHPFAPDPRPSEADVARMLRTSGTTEAILIEASAPPAPGDETELATRAAPTVERRRLGSMTMEIPLLPRRLDPSDEAWRELAMDLDVWLVELAPATEPAAAGR